MNTRFLLIALATTAISSCSTAYKTGQTPDDVYYSPNRAIEDQQEDEKKQDTYTVNENAEDREIRMRIRNRRYRNFDNDWSYNPYNYGYSYGYYYNPYYCYQPVYCNTCYTSSFIAPASIKPRTVNLGGYNNNASTLVNYPKNGVSTSAGNGNGPVRTYNNRNNGLGNVVRQILTPNSTNNSNNNNNNTPANNNNTRTYSPSSSSSSSGSSGSGSGAVSRPGRGG